MAAVALSALSITVAVRPALGADNPYQRGPNPTRESVAASHGSFATATMNVPSGNGFTDGHIYYPTDTSQGTFGAIAWSPGYNGSWDAMAWAGPWLASFGFVVIGFETIRPGDGDAARGVALLAALDYLTLRSPVRDRIDTSRQAVIGHSMGGGGAMVAASRRPSLKTAVGLAPAIFSTDMSTLRLPIMFMVGQRDGTVSPSYAMGYYNRIPASTEKAYVELTGASHGFPSRPNPVMMRNIIPWLKIFVDRDARYQQFLCPLVDSTGISRYQSSCPLLPAGEPTTPPVTTPPVTTPPVSTPPATTPPVTTPPVTTPPVTTPPPAPGGGCSASYRAVNAWPGGYQGEVTVTAGSSAITGWTISWTLSSGQSISQVWNGALTTSGSAVSVRNAGHNGSLQPGASTTFGFIGNGTASTPSLICTKA